MQIRKIPSAQHLVRYYNDDPEKVCKEIVKSAESPPRFSYGPFIEMLTSAIRFHEPLAELEAAIKQGVSNERTRGIYLDLLPHAYRYLTSSRYTYIQPFGDRLTYNAGRGLIIPVSPICFMGTGAELVVPHISLWRNDVMDGKRLSLFATIFDDVIRRDPDFQMASLEFVDLSAPKRSGPRHLTVTPFRDIPLLGKAETTAMLEVLHAGLAMAEIRLSSKSRIASNVQQRTDNREQPDKNQGDFFIQPA